MHPHKPVLFQCLPAAILPLIAPPPPPGKNVLLLYHAPQYRYSSRLFLQNRYQKICGIINSPGSYINSIAKAANEHNSGEKILIERSNGKFSPGKLP
jgi:hypothetical protein